MRVIISFVDLDRASLALNALAETGVEFEARYVGGSDEDYYHVLAEAWSDGDEFTVVEHDIEVRSDTLDILEACPEPWCGFAYAMGPAGYMAALGCTRFKASFIATHPNFMAEIGEMEDPWGHPRDWRRLDSRIAQRMSQLGLDIHTHFPPLEHHNPEKQVPVEATWI